MRGLPFLLAYIKMVIACRAAPIDSRGGLARNKAAVLPEIFTRPGAATAVETVDYGCRDTPRFENEPRHAGGERTAFAGRSADSRSVLVCALWRARKWRPRLRCHRPIRSVP